MIVVASGEGPSDLGGGYGGDTRFGPIAYLLNQLGLPLSPDATWHWASKDELRGNSRTLLPGKKRQPGGAFFRANALGLANIAKRMEEPTCAVLFRDSDWTHNSSKHQYEEQWLSFEAGFAEAEYENWIGLLPRPKSEVWLLCAMQVKPYQNCAKLESLPGNDASPRAPKRALTAAAQARGIGTTAEELVNWVRDNPELATRITMPSWEKTKERVAEVLARL